MGRIGDGYTPGTFYEDGKPETSPIYLLDYLDRLALNNAHGGKVLAEVVGITPNGRLVVVQPYIPRLIPSDHGPSASMCAAWPPWTARPNSA